MTDISKEVDLLLKGAAPERYEEIKAEWGEQADRVRSVPLHGFHLQHLYGTIQLYPTTLSAIWLASFASWKAVQSYTGVIWLLARDGRDFDPAMVAGLHEQAAADAEFDAALKEVDNLLKSASLEDFDWPKQIPAPDLVQQYEDINDAAARDLALITGAYVILHELGHYRIEASGNIPAHPQREERMCDAYAREMLLCGAGEYATANNVPEEMVRAKRLLGILFAKLLIISLTPREKWAVSSSEHESARRRLFRVLRYARDPLPSWFWDAAASLLAAYARRHGLLDEPIQFPSTRELAFGLCRKFT